MNIFNLFRPKTKPFAEVLREYFTHISPGLSDSTLEKHRFIYNNIEKFLRSRGTPAVQVHEIKIKTMEEMRLWLHAEKKRSIGHVSRHIEVCQAACDFAVMMEYYTHNQIDVIKCKRDEDKDIVSLDIPDLRKLVGHQFTSDAYKLVADLFLFQCFTGLSYGDLWSYRIERDEDPKSDIFWVASRRHKNRKAYAAEFNQLAKAIHLKYEGKFPKVTNQSYNRTIKKIAFTLNITKNLSSHNARKTYATHRYKQGATLELICQELGNNPTVANKHYILKDRDRIKFEIKNLKTGFLSGLGFGPKSEPEIGLN